MAALSYLARQCAPDKASVQGRRTSDLGRLRVLPYNMDQQQTSSRDEESTGASTQQQQQPQSSRPAGDDTWGVGSSSALDCLRERNYRGRRGGQAGDGRPTSE